MGEGEGVLFHHALLTTRAQAIVLGSPLAEGQLAQFPLGCLGWLCLSSLGRCLFAA